MCNCALVATLHDMVANGMTNPTYRVSVISRQGKRGAAATAAYNSGTKLVSIVACASYRAAEKLYDERLGKTFDFSRKEHVVFTETLLPRDAPDWDRQALVNAIEASETRKNARLARSLIVSLPRELTLEQNIRLIREHVLTEFVNLGMCADLAVHDSIATDGGRNPHAHILLSTRHVTQDGFGKKNREWDKPGTVETWRNAWERLQNQYLEDAGSAARIDMRSYERQGNARIPPNPSQLASLRLRTKRHRNHQRELQSPCEA